MSPATKAEEWFERYLADAGYAWDYECDLGIRKRPDYVVSSQDFEIVCEVEELDALSAFATKPGLSFVLSSKEEFGPVRRKIALTTTASIIAGNTSDSSSGPSDCAGGGHVVSHGYNLIGNTSEDSADGPCSFQLVATDRAGTTPIDPRLLPLGSYGGSTQTVKPASNSPAVDAIPVGAQATDGAELCPSSGTVDQRGKPRPNGPACDIGAVER